MTSLTSKARLAGILYIAASAVGIVRLLYVPNHLFVFGNAAATANNIIAHERLFRAGILCYVLGGALWLFVPLALYRLLKDVDRTLAVLIVILGGLMQVPTYFLNVGNDLAALLLAKGQGYISVLDAPQRFAFARLFLDLHHQLDLANMLFAGLWLIPFGLLVYKSGFLPRLLGAWLVLASLPYIGLTVFGFLTPGAEDKIFSYGQPLLLSEVAIMLWLTLRGVNETRARPGTRAEPATANRVK